MSTPVRATPIRAALYLRVSTGRQADSDLSIPDQRRQAETICKARGWEVGRRLRRARANPPPTTGGPSSNA